jgi:hypothetical protein
MHREAIFSGVVLSAFATRFTRRVNSALINRKRTEGFFEIDADFIMVSLLGFYFQLPFDSGTLPAAHPFCDYGRIAPLCKQIIAANDYGDTIRKWRDRNEPLMLSPEPFQK